MLFASRGCGGSRLAGGGLVQGHAGSIVGKPDAILFEGRLDPPVGLVADLELLARWGLHLAAENLDPWVDAVELGLERLIDDLGEFRVLQHFEPDLFHQFSDALAIDAHRQRDLELVDNPVPRIIADAAQGTVRHEMQGPVLVAQRYRAKGDALYGALGIPAFDVVPNAKDV